MLDLLSVHLHTLFTDTIQGDTPLHYACQRYNDGDDNSLDAIITLIHASADVSIKNNISVMSYAVP